MSSSSTSTPVIPAFDQQLAQFLQSISSIASGIGQSVYNWGQGVFNNVQHVTDANIGQYLDTANRAGGLASNIISQYENVAAPQYNALAQEANTYAGTPFIKQQMGEAEATAAQAGDAARQNAIRDLQSYGIDPSAGRYAALDAAERTAAGASEAAAGTQSALATKAQGLDLRKAAVTAGAQLPGAAVNSLNSQLQGIAGAENSVLGAANTGVNLQQASAPFFNAAMGLRYPPSGQQSQSTSASGQQLTTGPGSNNSDKAKIGQGPGPQSPDNSYAYHGGQGPPMGSSNSPGSATVSAPRGGGGGSGSIAKTIDTGFSDAQGGVQDPFAPNPGGGAQDFGGGATDFGVQAGAQDYGGGATDFGVPADTTGFGPQDFGGGATDFGSASQTPMQTDFSQDPTGGMGMMDPYGAGVPADYSQYSDPGLSAPTTGDAGGGYNAGDFSGSMGGGTTSGFAGGGAIPGGVKNSGQISASRNQTTGGHVPSSASPSQGQQTDDIHANLNAGEFVVPKDIAEWKGQEFFHKLIADSRMKRQQMQAAVGTGAKMKPQAPGPVTFQSQRMGQ